MVRFPRRFALADTAQQIVGGVLLSGPFVVTEEVWRLAASMTGWHAIFTFCLVLIVGYAALYKADNRNPDSEQAILGIPLRFVSLVLVAHIAVLVLALVFAAPSTFFPDESARGLALITLKAASIGAVFSITGAAAADSLFPK